MPQSSSSGSAAGPARRKYLARVVVLSMGFLLIFSAFSTIQTLMSTVLDTQLAFWTLSILYLSFGISNFALAGLTVELLGVRYALVLGALPYILMDVAYVIAIDSPDQLSLQYKLLIPAAVLVGIGASILWTAQGTYLSRTAATKESAGFYSGIFFSVYLFAAFVGAIGGAALLSARVDKGVVFKLLTGIASIGFLLLIYLCFTEEPSEGIKKVGGEKQSTLTRMSKTARKIASPRMVALTPMFYMQSVQQAFYNATFPLFIASFHDPNTDLSIKLYLAGTLALASSCVALVLTKVGYRLRSLHLLSAVWASQALALLLVLFLRPVNNLAALFPIGIILGVTDAVIRTQNFILINEMFPEAADTPSAFACFNFHQSLGLGIFFISSKYLLGPDRVPNMAVWVPLQMGIFLIAVIGVGMGQRWYSPRSQHATSAPLEEVVKIEEDSLGIALDDTIATRDSSKM